MSKLEAITIAIKLMQVLIAVMLLSLLRIEIVQRVRNRMIEEDYQAYRRLPCSWAMIWQLNKWTYNQFYKGI